MIATIQYLHDKMVIIVTKHLQKNLMLKLLQGASWLLILLSMSFWNPMWWCCLNSYRYEHAKIATCLWIKACWCLLSSHSQSKKNSEKHWSKETRSQSIAWIVIAIDHLWSIIFQANIIYLYILCWLFFSIQMEWPWKIPGAMHTNARTSSCMSSWFSSFGK